MRTLSYNRLSSQPVWHPCTQMYDHQQFHLPRIKCAKGPYLETEEGTQIIDAISSWWCKSLGHNHPRLKKALYRQAELYEHVILPDAEHKTLRELSENLLQPWENLSKVFYASEGSSAVEVALKLSLHSRQISGEMQRTQVMRLENAYHGETLLAMSISDLGQFSQPFHDWLLPMPILQAIPYVNNTTNHVWQNCQEHWTNIESQLNRYRDTLTAIIVEPIVQGAAGMLIYSQDFLRRLRNWTEQHQIHLIADEIMTGMGRTGQMFACQHANIEPDFICLGKALTAGWLPMSAVLIAHKIDALFYADYATGKTFMHSHTFGGNALAAAIALENLQLMQEENICQQVRDNENLLQQLMLEVADATQHLTNIRGIGGIMAADLILPENPKGQRYGYQVFQQGIKLGAWLRPLGNTIYWLPPLNIDKATLYQLRDITIKAIKAVFHSSQFF